MSRYKSQMKNRICIPTPNYVKNTFLRSFLPSGASKPPNCNNYNFQFFQNHESRKFLDFFQTVTWLHTPHTKLRIMRLRLSFPQNNLIQTRTFQKTNSRELKKSGSLSKTRFTFHVSPKCSLFPTVSFSLINKTHRRCQDSRLFHSQRFSFEFLFTPKHWKRAFRTSRQNKAEFLPKTVFSN